jgi:hypothetical protein
VTPACRACNAGALLSFNWHYAKTTARPDAKRDLSVFVSPQPLRWGTLYRCVSCGQPWFLDGDARFMGIVPRDRVSLIEQWNERPIELPAGHREKLDAIGRTPPDPYGNGAQFHETPCGVVTASGERIDLAIVSVQRHPPFEPLRHYRLASEIADIYPSPYALPLAVRTAASQATEIRMGLAPTLVELPDGQLAVLNGAENFFVREGCDAASIKLSRRRMDLKSPPDIHSSPKNVTYFVADPTR